MDYLLYNAGDAIEETIKFSLSPDRADHATGNWPFRLESKEFTSIPTELAIGDAETTLRVEFPFDIVRKYGARGVVILVDAKEKQRRFGQGPIPEHQPFAVTQEQAEQRGRELWHGYTFNIAQTHINEAMQSRASGGPPRKAQGFTARCLKLHNIIDPADEMFLRMTQGAGNPADVQKMVNEAVGQAVKSLIAIPGVAEALAAAGAQAAAVATPEAEPSPAPAKPPQHGKGAAKLPTPQPVKAPAGAGA